MQAERTLPELTKDFTSQLGDLVRNEVRLARAEMLDGVKGVRTGITRMAIGLALACAAVTLGLFAIAFGLGEFMPMWLSALICAAVAGIVAYVLVKSGSDAAAFDRIAPRRAAQQVANDFRLMKEKARYEFGNRAHRG
jgi:hypothetical protein